MRGADAAGDFHGGGAVTARADAVRAAFRAAGVIPLNTVTRPSGDDSVTYTARTWQQALGQPVPVASQDALDLTGATS